MMLGPLLPYLLVVRLEAVDVFDTMEDVGYALFCVDVDVDVLENECLRDPFLIILGEVLCL